MSEVVVSERIDKIVYGIWWFLLGLFIGSFIWIIPYLIIIFIPIILLPFALFSWYGVFIYGLLFSAAIVYLVLRLTKVEKYKKALMIVGVALTSSIVPYIVFELLVYFIARP
ncbi:MAG: hypothetical protein DRO40_07825 [Thermoprotei archaeon]|nr:MAG: hypothetical protein DRO40_07825 [Thermoprotei archaeon]